MKIRVLIVEDSLLYQKYLGKVLEADPCLEVAGIAGTGEEARKMAETLKPDVITLDLNLPDVTDFGLLKRLLRDTDIPVIVVSSQPQSCEEAIRLGAKDFIGKISQTGGVSPEQFAMLLKVKVKMLARWFRRVPPGTDEERKKTAVPHSERTEKGRPEAEHPQRGEDCLIAIGASLGGTESTLEVLRELPADMPGILIVQHMPVGFTRAYAMRLNQGSRLEVAEAKNGDRILPGRVLVAESGKHMRVVRTADGCFVRCREGDKVNGFCPSVDVLFSSVADAGVKGAGVILTGMGRDGVRGIRKMREKGFYTVGQDRESCAVFGMPQAAWQEQGVDELLNPQQIAERLIAQYRLGHAVALQE